MTNRLKTLIIDDEPLARKGLEIRLRQYPEIEIIAQCSSGREAVAAVKQYQPDLMFLDIQMPGLNGFQVIQTLQQQQIPLPMTVFVTAFDQYAVKAFEVHALDYVLKPVDENRLRRAVEKILDSVGSQRDSQDKQRLVRLVSDVTGTDCEKILEQLAMGEPVSVSNYPEVLVIKDGAEVSRVPVSAIVWIDAAGDYMCVHTSSSTHILRKTMKELENELDPKQFIRSHRSVIVNKSYVEKLCCQVNGEYHLVLSNGEQLKVSRSYRNKVKSAIIS
jgi:two-component system, LytTR family, response regulator